MVRLPRGFLDEVLWPEFNELNRALVVSLEEVTVKVIAEVVHADASEATEVPQALPAGQPVVAGEPLGTT